MGLLTRADRNRLRGQAEKDGHEHYGFECWGDASLPCLTRVHIGPVWTKLVVEFREDRLIGVQMEFRPESSPVIREMFIGRYGQPTSRQRPAFVTRGGLRAENELLIWDGARVHIWLTRFHEKITEGGAYVALQQEIARREAEQRKAVQKGKGGL